MYRSLSVLLSASVNILCYYSKDNEVDFTKYTAQTT
jgi:hypothetical protein